MGNFTQPASIALYDGGRAGRNQMKACILEAPGRLAIETIADPEPGPGDIVVKVHAALTCGTDLKAYRRGHPKMPCPTPFGHELAGEIVALGPDVQGFNVGDSIMTANTGPCFSCFFCDRGQENLCETIMDEMILGAYAEFVRISGRIVRSNVYRKPDELAYEQAALLEPLSSVCFGMSLTPKHLYEKPATALIIGAGPIALLWLVALKDVGISKVMVAGRRRPRLDQALGLGAGAVFGEGDDLSAAINDCTDDRGADLVVECTGLPEVWEAAPSYARKGGTVVLFGGCKLGSKVSFDTYRLHYDGVSIVSPFHFRPADVARSYDFLARGVAPWDKFVTSRATLDEVPEVFKSLDNGVDIKCAILPHGED